MLLAINNCLCQSGFAFDSKMLGVVKLCHAVKTEHGAVGLARHELKRVGSKAPTEDNTTTSPEQRPEKRRKSVFGQKGSVPNKSAEK